MWTVHAANGRDEADGVHRVPFRGTGDERNASVRRDAEGGAAGNDGTSI